MRDAFIVEAVRGPVGRGKPGGALSALHPVDLLAQVLRGLVDRAGVDPGEVEDVIAGCVGQGGEQAFNIGRNAVLAAGFPETVPGTTVDRQCGSSQQAAHFAAQGVIAGAYDLVIACGVEAMSHVPMGAQAMGQDPFGSTLHNRYGGLVPQGISAELIAAKWGFGRDQLDELAVRSHRLAAAATEAGNFSHEILPLTVGENGSSRVVDRDEGIRPDSTVATLAGLKPAFAADHWKERFPEINWVITAANSSQISDGASALLIASEDAVKRLNLRPLARFHQFALAGDDPIYMLTGVIPATARVLKRAGMKIEDIDYFEVNEAFAPVVLAWQHDHDVDPSRVNVHGGAMALGHPLGASGGRLMTTLVNVLAQKQGRFGLQTMCEGGGMANATILERV